MSLIEAQEVVRTFGSGARQVQAVERISLSVEAGEHVSVVGPSGCGKSTLLDMLCGLDSPTSGRVLWEGRAGSPRGRVAALPQGGALLGWRTVIDNVAVAARIAGISRKESRARALSLLTEFGLDRFANHYPAQLSGGMRARVAFLRTVLAGRPAIALDEPFAALDALTREEVQEWLLEALPDQTAMVLVTHDIAESVLLGDRVVVLSSAPARIVGEVTVPEGVARAEDRSSPEFVRTVQRIRDLLRTGRRASDAVDSNLYATGRSQSVRGSQPFERIRYERIHRGNSRG
ncbi:MAG: ABC transporter ATP-binding protein [Microbacteriaceae bacterium]|jgi:ABC-type nitrate/sulfonate/bicarbonate transport system ATPase subunit|nr:ABC transporter ATP-binding protein [Microbacteriaceae bacterium]MCI1207743.1 ABC transporter ATP-binding protein [Microbacteriaceae bacterium]